MSLSLVTPAVEEAVSLEEFKQHIIQTQPADEQDADISLKLLAARHYIEGELGRTLITSTWQLNLGHWPRKPFLEFPLGNLQSVDWVKYLQPGAVEPITWESANYKFSRRYDPNAGVDDAGAGRLWHGYGIPWPPGPLDVGEPVSIQFVAGWKDASAVPPTVKSAIMLVAGLLFNNRSASVMASREVSAMLSMNAATGAVEALLAKYKLYE